MQILEPTLDPTINHPWSLVGKMMISSFPSLILRVFHVIIFMQHVSYLGIRIIVCHVEGMLFYFKGKHAQMSCYHHIDMFHTHFMHYCHEGCCIKKSMFYTFHMVYVASLNVHVRSQSSLKMFTYVSVISL